MDPEIASQACSFDLTDEKSVIQHFRDLYNLADLLLRGLDEEMRRFRDQLGRIGWGYENIQKMIMYGGYGTRFEYMTDCQGNSLLPRPIPEQGSQREWSKLKARTKR